MPAPGDAGPLCHRDTLGGTRIGQLRDLNFRA